MDSAVRNDACRLMRSSNSAGRSVVASVRLGVDASSVDEKDDLVRGDCDLVFEARKRLSNKVLAPLVGVLAVESD